MSADRDTLRSDRRAVTVTDTMAVGAMLAFALVLASGLGVSILLDTVDENQNTTVANFSYNHYGETSRLVVRFTEGENVSAGDILITSAEENATWATIANVTNDTYIEIGDAVQLSQESNFENSVTTGDTIVVYWTGNGTQKVSEYAVN